MESYSNLPFGIASLINFILEPFVIHFVLRDISYYNKLKQILNLTKKKLIH